MSFSHPKDRTAYTALTVLRSRLSFNPADGMGVFTSTMTCIEVTEKKIHTLVGWCKFSKVVGYEGPLLLDVNCSKPQPVN